MDDSPGAGGATVVTDPDLGRAWFSAALLGVIGRLAEGRPAVLAVDDLHLAGSSTIAWLGLAARRMPRLLVVAATRPAAEPILNADVTLVLGPLGLEAAAAVVGPSRAAELHARSGGNPLLLTALAQDAEGELPESVREAADRRVGGLGPAGAATIRTAAIIGADVDLDLLSEVARTPAVVLLDHLEAAVAAGLLVERGAGFAFRHEIEREALEASTGSARRALVHREAARTLSARRSPEPLQVAVHARLGGETALAADWFVRAAEVAVSRYDLEAAEAHLDVALALVDSATARAARARARMAGGRLDEAADDAARAVAAGGGAPALEVAGWVAYYRRRHDEARRYAEAGVAQAVDPAVRVSCLALGGRIRHSDGDMAGALAHLEPAVAEQAPPEVVGLAEVWLAQVRLHQGRPTDALALLRPVADRRRPARPSVRPPARTIRPRARPRISRSRRRGAHRQRGVGCRLGARRRGRRPHGGPGPELPGLAPALDGADRECGRAQHRGGGARPRQRPVGGLVRGPSRSRRRPVAGRRR